MPEEVKVPVAKTDKRLEVVDDFIRNFLIKHKMNRSLEVFQVRILNILMFFNFSKNGINCNKKERLLSNWDKYRMCM